MSKNTEEANKVDDPKQQGSNNPWEIPMTGNEAGQDGSNTEVEKEVPLVLMKRKHQPILNLLKN